MDRTHVKKAVLDTLRRTPPAADLKVVRRPRTVTLYS